MSTPSTYQITRTFRLTFQTFAPLPGSHVHVYNDVPMIQSSWKDGFEMQRQRYELRLGLKGKDLID